MYGPILDPSSKGTVCPVEEVSEAGATPLGSLYALRKHSKVKAFA